MRAVKSTHPYQVGGSLDSQSLSYVQRQADITFYHALKAGQFCYVFNARQMGKSSLRVRTMTKLQAEEIICVGIDLTSIGSQDVTLEKWYAGIFYTLVSGCQLISKFEWRIWWRKQRELFSPVQCLSLFIEEILLVEISKNIVIFIDEIDYVLSQSFCIDDFFRLIRYCYDKRSLNKNYKRLTFALLGVATPANLIQDKTQTPFNIGQAIELQGFAPQEVQPLIDGLRGKIEDPEGVMKAILDWTEGQPFLTQKLCQLVIDSTPHHFDSPSEVTLASAIAQLVHTRIVNNWLAQDQPQHLRTIHHRLLRNEQKAVQLLGLYQKIWQQGQIDSDGSPEQMELRLSGLVVENEGQLKVYNPIYKAVFNQNWITQHLNRLRPYSSAIAAWLASERQNHTCLLQGETLQTALTWALGKSLSEEDYQFLVASQDLAKRQAQQKLEATEQASHLLASARATAKQAASKQRIGWQWIPFTAGAITLLILLLRFSGLLQGVEWNWLDRFFRWRPPEASDERIVIVTINEIDLAQIGQWPIPDATLAQAITNIKAAKPQAIGLDLYRDLPVQPGHDNLVLVFQSTPNLFGIEKVVGTRIAPSPILQQQGQIGFADVVVDGDGKIRRALLSILDDNDEIHYGFAVQLALHYLKAQNIFLDPLDEEGQRVRLGKAIFERFRANDGGYRRAQSGGYQILLNWRGEQDHFLTFSLQEILNHQVPPERLRDRLVLIGTTAESINDFFFTPYSRQSFRSPEMMSGIMIHANIISQILSSALDGRPLMRVWPTFLEWLGILGMAVIGALMSWGLKSTGAIAFGLLGISGLLLGGCYLAFMGGWWLPLIPALLAFLGSAISLWIIINKQQNRWQFKLTLAYLLEKYIIDPQTGRIALEYFKQSENKENQRLIDQELNKLVHSIKDS